MNGKNRAIIDAEDSANRDYELLKTEVRADFEAFGILPNKEFAPKTNKFVKSIYTTEFIIGAYRGIVDSINGSPFMSSYNGNIENRVLIDGSLAVTASIASVSNILSQRIDKYDNKSKATTVGTNAVVSPLIAIGSNQAGYATGYFAANVIQALEKYI